MATEAAGTDHSQKRGAQDKDDRELNAAGKALLVSLPELEKPKKLAEAFPRIVNRMAALWKTPADMNRCFEELLTDTRGGRQGFPLGVLMELTSLKDYYQTKVAPIAKGDVWDVVEQARLKSH